MRRMLVKFALGVFKRADLTDEERSLCTGLILDRIGAAPLRAMISFVDELGEHGVVHRTLLVNGEELDVEKLRVLREAAKVAIENASFNLVADQVRWLAFKEGLATGRPAAELIFFRAALWFIEEMKKHLQLLAQQDQELPL